MLDARLEKVTTPGGQLELSGNVIVTDTLSINGQTSVTSTLESTSSTSGSLTVSGGLGVAKSLYVDGPVNLQNTTFTVSDKLSVNQTEINLSPNTVQSALFTDTSVTLYATAPSTSSTSAALLVTGGVSIRCTTDATTSSAGGGLTVSGGLAVSKSVRVGTTLHAPILDTEEIQIGTSVIVGNAAIGGHMETTAQQGYQVETLDGSISFFNLDNYLEIAGTFSQLEKRLIINATTASDSTTTGALIVSGGLGVEGAVNVGTSLTVPTLTTDSVNTDQVNTATVSSAAAPLTLDTLGGIQVNSATTGILTVNGSGVITTHNYTISGTQGIELKGPTASSSVLNLKTSDLDGMDHCKLIIHPSTTSTLEVGWDSVDEHYVLTAVDKLVLSADGASVTLEAGAVTTPGLLEAGSLATTTTLDIDGTVFSKPSSDLVYVNDSVAVDTSITVYGLGEPGDADTESLSLNTTGIQTVKTGGGATQPFTLSNASSYIYMNPNGSISINSTTGTGTLTVPGTTTLATLLASTTNVSGSATFGSTLLQALNVTGSSITNGITNTGAMSTTSFTSGSINATSITAGSLVTGPLTAAASSTTDLEVDGTLLSTGVSTFHSEARYLVDGATLRFCSLANIPEFTLAKSTTSLDITNTAGTLLSVSNAGLTSVTDLQVSSECTVGSLTVTGSTSLKDNLTVSKAVTFTSTVDSIDENLGGVTVSGGVAIKKNCNIGGNLVVSGLTTFNGGITRIESEVTTLADNILTLNSGPNGSKDSGVIVHRYQTSNDTGAGDVVNDDRFIEFTIPDQTTASSTQVKLSVDASSVDGFYDNQWVRVTSGFSNNQVRQITAYIGSTRMCTLSAEWTDQNPSNGDTLSVFNKGYVGFFYNELTDLFEISATATDQGNNLETTEFIGVKAWSLNLEDGTPSTSSTTGALVLKGGVSIQCTQNSTSPANGGSLTTLGGASFGKDVIIDGNLDVRGTLQGASRSTTFNADNGQTEIPFVDLSADTFGCEIFLSSRLIATTSKYSNYRLSIINTETGWYVSQVYTGDDSLVDFTMNGVDQLCYTTPSYPGFVSLTFKYTVLINGGEATQSLPPI